MSDTTTPHPLYEAGINYLVSDRTNADAWEKVAQFVEELRRQGHDHQRCKEEFAIVERQIKAEYKLTAMPSAWRSAKSAALKAMMKGTTLTDSDGTLLGKSAVEAACKPTTPDVDPVAITVKNLREARNRIRSLPLGNAELIRIHNEVVLLTHDIATRRAAIA